MKPNLALSNTQKEAIRPMNTNEDLSPEDYKSQARDEYSSKPDSEKLRKMLPSLRVRRTNAAQSKLRKGEQNDAK